MDSRSRRARRAIPLIAAALAAVVVTSLLFLRSEIESSNPTAAPSPSPKPIPRLAGTYTPTFAFVDPSHGWAVVLDYGPQNRFWIFKTTDGAQHWSRQFAGVAVGSQTYLRFFDLQHGFAYAGALYRTVDGGSNWDSVRTPTEDPNPLFTFANAATGWILGPQLYTTDDGGTTWTVVPGALPPTQVVDLPGTPGDLAFRADGEGWLGAGTEEPVVFVTRDGGSSWNAIPVPNSQPGLHIYNTTVRLLPGNAILAIVGSPAGVVDGYYSGNRGASWRQVQPLPQPEWLADASFIDSVRWWVARYGFLYKTSNAGQNWTRVSVQPLPEGWNIGPVHAIDAKHGWWQMTATTDSRDSALMVTSDGGTEWRAVNMPQPG